VKRFPSRTRIGKRVQHFETLMLNYGYDAQLPEAAAGFPDIDFRLQDHWRGQGAAYTRLMDLRKAPTSSQN
jgi:hypothetical protein